ncbi:MAG TPA: hypothetical protein VFY13_04095, partial [Luteolibacter sp.]|nr:hypothetical protein [Luteolibacter sp.]
MKPSRPTLLLALLLSACNLGPDYQRPRFLCVFDWKQGKGDSSAQVPDEWWRLYQDKTLNRLVTEALAANPTLDA